MLVDEVVKYGGDILKFAGDAFFAEWRVKTEDEVDAEKMRRLQNHPLTNLRASFLALNCDTSNIIEERSITDCVLAASQCAASIVEQYSDFQLQTSRELSISFGKEQQGKNDTMLNVHCGIGCGSLVGLHVGDTINSEDPLLETRREFLFLGKPIDQVSLAVRKASPGEVFASPEVIRELKKTCIIPEELESDGPVCIAARAKTFFQQIDQTKPALAKVATKETTASYCESLLGKCADMDEMMLGRLHRQLSLYVHQVVRDDELDVTTSHHSLGSMRSKHSSTNRHLAEAELRLVYTMFINANIDPVVTGDSDQDALLFQKLQRVMQVTCRELHKCNGQLRQFIIDDKGVVLIGTFGLRGSTFANMVTNHALPATFAIHEALKNELQVENKIGATFGKAYCGVVGGVRRHEFAVMGAPVNLAARLMYSKDNSGILVDEAVQAHADSRFAFKRLPPIEAKGYNKPVIIFQPLHAVHSKKRGMSHGFIGRHRDVAELTDVAKSIVNDPDDSSTIMAFIIGEPGIGKSALGLCVYEEMKLYTTLHQKKMIFYRSTSTETEQRIPLSSFRKIFLGAVRELCMHDGTLASFNDETRLGASQRIIQRRSSMRGMRPSTVRTARRMSLGRVPSTRALPPQRRLHRGDSNQSLASMRSTRSANVPYLRKMCDICEELQYPYEFADIVGSQLLGLEGANPTTHIDGRVPSVDEVVDFLSSVYIRLTEFADLTMIFLDDFQWIDSFTWKVIRALCEKGKNILIMGAMRSQETQALRRMSSVAMWHTRMQSRKGIVEVNIGPLETDEVKQLISKVLDYHVDIIDEQLSNDIYQKTGGITIYVIELLESIKRNKTVAIDDDTGLLRWTPEAEREQKRIGSNSVAAIELSFLNRFDSLDLAVRRVLQTCAVLGMSFSLSDVIRVHPEMDELVLELSLNAAVDELILVEDIEDDEDDEMSLWSGKGSHVESRGLVASWNAVDDRFFQFSHAMWRKSVLDAMLSEQKVHLHRTIADAMEKEQVLVMESSDIGRLLTLFDHWKSCGNFGKAAPLALAVGLRLEEWDLSAQSLDLYRDALEMCYESADNPEEGEQTRDENEVWLPASAPPATVEFILRLHIRIAKCHAHLGEQEQCATTFEDAYKIMTTSPKAAKLNQELVLPIISGLCSIAIQGNVVSTDLLAANEELVERFVREARERDDDIHISRALAMKASFYARLGQFAKALEVQEELEQVYVVELHSSGIREEYGKDYAGQSYADSVQWYMLVGDQPAAERQVDVVIQGHLPQFDLRDVDTVMDIIFPVLIVLKSIGRSRDAETILFNNAINPYHDLGGSSSCWLKLFNPIAYLFEVLKMIEDNEFDDQMLTEIEDWVTDPERSIFNIDLQYKGYALIGEICSHLASFKIQQSKDPQMLLDRGHTLLTRVVYAVDDDQSERFMVQQARKALNAINAMEDVTDAQENAAMLTEMASAIEHSNSNGTTTNGYASSAKAIDLGDMLVGEDPKLAGKCCVIL
jgi:class 3 adenylate cyclase/tetratricopeptide (TPR) repeat protein